MTPWGPWIEARQDAGGFWTLGDESRQGGAATLTRWRAGRGVSSAARQQGSLWCVHTDRHAHVCAHTFLNSCVCSEVLTSTHQTCVHVSRHVHACAHRHARAHVSELVCTHIYASERVWARQPTA